MNYNYNYLLLFIYEKINSTSYMFYIFILKTNIYINFMEVMALN